MKAVVVENYDSIDGISIKEIDTPGLSNGEVRSAPPQLASSMD